MSCKRLIALGLLGVAVAGCAHVDPVTGSVDKHFGEALAWNKEVQTVNPDPVYPAEGAKPGDNGERAADAAERYRKGQVKPVETIGTGGSTGGSGPR